MNLNRLRVLLGDGFSSGDTIFSLKDCTIFGPLIKKEEEKFAIGLNVDYILSLGEQTGY